MTWNVPNQITVARIILAGIFFALLGLYNPNKDYSGTLVQISFVIFVLAAGSDFLDGYLARKWNQVTAFGRIADPFVDKILIVGAFVLLAGRDFSVSPSELSSFEQSLPTWVTANMSTCMQPWMVVVILAREFVVSAIRGFSESQGKKFPAIAVGKLKMILQSIAVGAIVFCLAWGNGQTWCNAIKVICVWLTLIVTIYSGVIYVVKSKSLLSDN